MSNPLQNTIKSMIDVGVKASKTTLMTEIVKYNHEGRTIDVKPVGQDGGVSLSNGNQSDNLIKNITVLNSRVIKDEGFQPGDLAYIDFLDSTQTSAVVLNIIKREVFADTDRSGATLLKPLSSQAPPMWSRGGE